MSDGRALDRARAARIAAAYKPAHWFGNRWNYFYSRAKLASDPLYPAVADALRGTSAPLLDLGCGIGLLALAWLAVGVRQWIILNRWTKKYETYRELQRKIDEKLADDKNGDEKPPG